MKNDHQKLCCQDSSITRIIKERTVLTGGVMELSGGDLTLLIVLEEGGREKVAISGENIKHMQQQHVFKQYKRT